MARGGGRREREPIVADVLEGDSFGGAGSIAERVAHEFRNLVMPSLTYPMMIRKDLGLGSQSRDLLDQIEKTARDMAYVVSQLSVLAATLEGEEEPVNINGTIGAALAMLRHEGIPSGIDVSMTLSREVGEVSGQEDLIEKAIYNLCRNGLESMGDGGGELSVTSERIVLEPGTMCGGIAVVQGGPYVKVSVRDTGPGIAEEVERRMFEPFVTTKKKSLPRGAGLGLSIVYRVVKGCGGYIDYESSADLGTTFSVLFPAGGAPLAEGEEGPAVEARGLESADTEKAATQVPGTRRVLIVDDDKQIVRLFEMILSAELGCPIDVAGNGAEALEAFRENQQSVLLMDLHMPVMDGRVAFSAIEKLCRDNRWEMPAVVFCTGFAPPDAVKHAVSASPKHGLLSKPVRGETLVEAVRSRL